MSTNDRYVWLLSQPDIKYGVECIKNEKPEKSGEDEIYLFPQAV